MPPRAGVTQFPVILCQRSDQLTNVIRDYAEALKAAAPTIGAHGMGEEEFWASGLFRGAIERLRGQQAASMTEKRQFIRRILDHLWERGFIENWTVAGGEDRHDYELRFADGRIAAIEAKGCLDGNNTNIFERPANADEFVIWSLCQNPGADPRHNVWSGIHTRLSAEIMSRRQRVDGLIVWDMVCGTVGRPCPKIVGDGANRRSDVGGRQPPPPCLYLFPRTVPDPRNNPAPRCWTLPDVASLNIFHQAFNGDENDVVEVQISADMDGATARRTTRLVRRGVEVFASEPTPILRAR